MSHLFVIAHLAMMALLAMYGTVLAEPADPVAVSTESPDVPIKELDVLLKPLTKAQLLVEADAWMSLLERNAQAIASAELTVMRQNQAIKKAEQVKEKVEETQEKIIELKKSAEEAQLSGDAESIRKAEEAATDAQEQLQEVAETVQEASDASRQAQEATESLDPELESDLAKTGESAHEAEELVQKVEEAAKAAALETREGGDASLARETMKEASEVSSEAETAADAARESASKALEKAESADRTVEQVRNVADELAAKKEEKEEQKISLVEKLTELRENRTRLIDRMKTVLDALSAKSSPDDADTQAVIRDYQLYMDEVGGLKIDLEDTASAWATIKGWVMSPEGGVRLARNVGLFLGVLILAWMVGRVLSYMVHQALKRADRVSNLLESFLVGAVRWVVLGVGVVMGLANLEVSVGPILAAIGGVAFVIALAMQESLSNFASGIMILLFRPFDTGCAISAGGVSGTVVSMNLVSTTIMTWDNQKMVVPNNKIWGDVITNITGAATRRVDLEFGVAYDADLGKVQQILESVVADHPLTLKEPAPNIRVHSLGDSAVNFICRPWARTTDYWDVHWDLTRTVKERFDAAGIGIPFPQRDVHLYVKHGGVKATSAPKPKIPSGTASPQQLPTASLGD